MSFTHPAVLPYIPEDVRVHLGVPSAYAANVTVPFVDYIKNVASSELYPDWPEEALRANIYAIISFTLNRIFTEWYPSRGYDFDITNTTQFDQAFVNGRNYFDNISQIVDEVFNSYLRMPNDLNPFYAQYCDGIQTQCDGLTQWGTVDLANQGMTAYEILQYFYGNNIEIVENVPIINRTPSYPGVPLRLGDESIYVRFLQAMLNKIRRTYSAIPAIPEENNVFDEYTEAAVKEYQRIFALTPDGIVGNATWYSIVRIYVSLRRLELLNSEAPSYEGIGNQYEYTLSPGQTGFLVELIQFYLNYISEFNEYISPVDVTGTFDSSTEQSVRDYQRFAGLPETGVIDYDTGLSIYNTYMGSLERGE